MRLTVLGGCGGWPAAGLACSGYLAEHDGFRLLIDPGYATLPRLLLAVADATEVDAVLVSHGHPDSLLLPHSVPNAGLRLEAGGQVLAYTGDSGPSPRLAELARGADVFLAEATSPWQVPGRSARYLSSARQAGEVAREAGAGRLVLTHLWPGTDPDEAVRAAAGSYPGEIAVASPGLVAEAGARGE